MIPVLSKFMKELFSAKYMIIIFIWLLILIIAPDDLKDSISEKSDLPFLFELFTFSFVVLLYALIFWVSKKIKQILDENEIRYMNEQMEQKKKEKEKELFEIMHSLNKEEKDLVGYLLNSGYSYIEFDAHDTNKYANNLIEKGLIIQVSCPTKFNHKSRFALEASLERFMKDILAL